jgi:hypothetical protein
MMLVWGRATGGAGAAEWSASPEMSVKGEYNSNLLLFDGNNEVFGYWISPGVTLKGATESLVVDSAIKADYVQYFGDQERTFTNLFVPLRTSYQWDRHRFGFNGGFTRDNTLRGELLQTGLVLAFTQRNLWTAEPSWTVGLTERLNWRVGYQFSDATYEDGLQLGLVDYRVHGGTTALSYQFTERDRVQWSGDVVHFQAPQIFQTWTYLGTALDWTHTFSESITASISGGMRFVTTTQDLASGSLTDQEVVGVYNARIKKEFERSTALLEAKREINPSGFGLLIQTDYFGGALSHNLTENLTLAVNGGLYFVSGITSPTIGKTIPETRFANVSPRLTWNFAQWWTLDLEYSYRERAVNSLNQWNSSNSMFLMLTYRGAKWSMSR